MDSSGNWYWHHGRFGTYFLNAAWARHAVKRWGPVVQALGFDGIHWDTLGRLAGEAAAEAAGTQEFLVEANQLLGALALKQTLNFVDLAWWSENLFHNRTVEFPYAEAWSMHKERALYDAMAWPQTYELRAVLSFYPSVDAPAGWSEEDTLLARAREARRHGVNYLAVGDGQRRPKGPYLGRSEPLSDAVAFAFIASRPPA